MIILTRELIEKGKSRNGGFSLAQLKILGYNDFYKGWLKDSIGKQILQKDYSEFIALADKHLKAAPDPNQTGLF